MYKFQQGKRNGEKKTKSEGVSKRDKILQTFN